jgi:hypothetical protein
MALRTGLTAGVPLSENNCLCSRQDPPSNCASVVSPIISGRAYYFSQPLWISKLEELIATAKSAGVAFVVFSSGRAL